MNTFPPQSPSSPLVQKLQWIFSPLELMDQCHQNYGDTFAIQLGKNARPMVVFSHPDVIRDIFKTPANQFDTGRANQILKPLLGSRSLELLDGKRHERHRKIMLPPFQGSRMQFYRDSIMTKAKDCIETWQTGQTLIARDCLQKLSFETMSQILFGSSDMRLQDEIYHCFDRLFQIASTSPLSSVKLFFPNLQQDWIPFMQWKEFSEIKAQLKRLIFEMIQLRRLRNQSETSQGHTDLTSMLIDATDDRDRPLTDDDLYSELMTLLFAGHETVATALAWTVYRIYQNRDYVERIRQEQHLAQNSPNKPERGHVSFLDAVISETLRIYPIGLILFPRILKQSMQLGGYDLPKGTIITGSIYLTHRRPDLYPNPSEFNPERFLERKYQAYEYYPFGGGNRRCLGSAFAPFMIHLVSSEIVQRWNLEVLEKNPLSPLRRGVTTAPRGGIKLQVTGPAQPKTNIPIPQFIPQSA